MTVSYNKLRLCAVLYAVLPIIIFFFGWISIGWAVLFSFLLLMAVFFLIKKGNSADGEYADIKISLKSIIIIAVISIVWCFLAGQGDFMHQSSDHIIRDAIFRDLIKMPWPVIYNKEQLLSYYIAHWMPSALIGKFVLAATGSSFAAYLAGNIALLIWSSLGIFITLMLLSLITANGKKNYPVAAVLIFIFFSGLDIIGTLTSGGNVSDHLEWWYPNAQFSSITTCLFWVYNQSIVSWLMTLCIVNEKKPANFALLGMLIFPYGPFPFLGALIICITKAAFIFVESFKNSCLKETLIKHTLTLRNVLSVAAIAPVYLAYYSANAIISNNAYYDNVKVNTGFRFHDNAAGNLIDFFADIAVFLLFEAGCFVLLILIHDKIKKRKNIVFIVSSVVLVFIPVFQVGKANDFGMRVSIPFVVYIAVEFIRLILEETPSEDERKSFDAIIRKKPLFLIAVLFLVIGAITPITEFSREISANVQYGINLEAEYYTNESLDTWNEKNNFTAIQYEESDYYKIFSRK